MKKNLTASQPKTTVLLELSPKELIILDKVLEQQWYQIQDDEYDSWLDTTLEEYSALVDKVRSQRKNLPSDRTSGEKRCSLLMIAR